MEHQQLMYLRITCVRVLKEQIHVLICYRIEVRRTAIDDIDEQRQGLCH